jgi:hypothetical protein
VERPGHSLNVTLDPEHAARLARLAERTHVQEGTLARSLLSLAIEKADPEARNIVAVLDGIPGAYEHAMQSSGARPRRRDGRPGRALNISQGQA